MAKKNVILILVIRIDNGNDDDCFDVYNDLHVIRSFDAFVVRLYFIIKTRRCCRLLPFSPTQSVVN